MGFAKLITKTYLIEIKTADEMMAGTDANVTLCMSGTKGDTGKSRTLTIFWFDSIQKSVAEKKSAILSETNFR